MTSRVEVPPPTANSCFRSVMERRDREDGSSEIVAVEQYVAVDGEWIDVRDLIEVWRRR